MNRLDVGTERSLSRVLRRMIVPALFVGALFVVLWIRTPEREDEPRVVVLSGEAFGTTYSLKLVADTYAGDDEDRRLEAVVRTVLEEVDRSMSTWREDSELSQLNKQGAGPFAASQDLTAVVATALEVSAKSRGALDVTVGPLVDAWGFGAKTPAEPPSEDRISELLDSTGMELVELDAGSGTIVKQVPQLRLDLSAIAKGFAVDRVTEALEAEGYSRLMVEIGGEVFARGAGPSGEGWRIGIEIPDPERQAVYTVVELDGKALATSGDYRNFRHDGGRILSHLIDPRTGRPVEHDLASVSVIANDCMTADAWATALSVMGPAEGMEVASREGLAALFITRAGEALEEQATPEFARYRAIES